MRIREAKWSLASLICLALWSTACVQNITTTAISRAYTDAAFEALRQDDYAEAELQFNSALTAAKDLEQPAPQLARVLTRLANRLTRAYRSQGKYAKAEPIIKNALAIEEKALGPEHPDLVPTLNYLAFLYKNQGKYAEAEPLLTQVLAIREKALGREHPDVVQSVNNVAGIYVTQGKTQAAELLFKRALAMREKALGPEHPHVAEILDNLGLLYHLQGKDAKARPLFKRSMAFVGKALESTDLARKLLPAVVNISTAQVIEQSQPGSKAPDPSPGSLLEKFFREFFHRPLGVGFIIDSSGLIVTIDHVIAEAEDLSVVLYDGNRLKAEVVGRDKKTDLALLRVKPSKPLPAVQLGNSDELRVGDQILVIQKVAERHADHKGRSRVYNPYYTRVGLGGVVTAGIVWTRADFQATAPGDDLIQAYPEIRRGGAPMFNLRGEVIGINSQILEPLSGVGFGFSFAVTANEARPVIDQLKTYGRVTRGHLGIAVQSVTDKIARDLELDRTNGALVANVYEGGPAQQGGIQIADVILTFDGKEVTGGGHLVRVIANTPVDKKVKVEVWRDSGKITLEVTLGELSEAKKD